MNYFMDCKLCHTQFKSNGQMQAERDIEQHLRDRHPEEWATVIKQRRELSDMQRAYYEKRKEYGDAIDSRIITNGRLLL